MKVRNMKGRSGKPVADQFVIEFDNCRIMQSYTSPVAYKHNNGKIILSDRWDYSITTTKYVAEFLYIEAKEIRRLIKSGVIQEMTQSDFESSFKLNEITV